MEAENRLRAYRNLEELSQQELADILGVSQPTISQMEKHRRPLDIDASILGYSLERFANLPVMSEPMHRARASTRVTSRKKAKEILRLAGEVYGMLLNSEPKAPQPRLPRTGPISADGDLDELAYEVRVGVLDQEEDAPIGNLTLALEKAGVIIVPIIGLDGIDGLSSWIEVGDRRIPVIGLDPLVPGDRFRLTLLHEVGHLVFHSKPGETTETEASRFARKVLVPDRHIEDLFLGRPPTLRDFVALKTQWGISVASIIYGAHHDLGLIDPQRFRSLQIQMAPWRRNEPKRFDPAPGRLLPSLVEQAGGSWALGERIGIAPRHVDLTVRWSHLRAI